LFPPRSKDAEFPQLPLIFCESIDLYPKHSALMPNDAIYPLRAMQVRTVCELIESLVAKSGLGFREVITKSVASNKDLIAKSYPFASQAIQVLIDDFSL
jgi:hypothetical protein